MPKLRVNFRTFTLDQGKISYIVLTLDKRLMFFTELTSDVWLIADSVNITQRVHVNRVNVCYTLIHMQNKRRI